MTVIPAKSFDESHIPRDFRLLFHFPNERIPDLVQQLAHGELKGVQGITDAGAVLQLRMLGQNRNAMLIMPGADVVALNKLSRISYNNPEYLMSKDMAAAQRLLGSRHDKESTIRKILYKVEETKNQQVRSWLNFWRQLDVFPSNALAAKTLNSVADFAKAWLEESKAAVQRKIESNKAWSSEEDLKKRYQPLLELDNYVQASKAGLLGLGKAFVWEGEWLVKDGALKIPKGSRLVVLDKGRHAAAAKAAIEEHKLDSLFKVTYVDEAKMQKAGQLLSERAEEVTKERWKVEASSSKTLYRTYVGDKPYVGPGSFWSPSADVARKYGPANGKMVSQKPSGKVLTVESDDDFAKKLSDLGVENADDLVMSSDWLTDADVLSALRSAGFSWVDRPVDLNQSASDREWVKVSASKEGLDHRMIRRMKSFFTKKWKEEKGRPDLTGACIFATAFARAVLGTGTVKGNWHHIWLEVDGQKVDLTEAFGVREQALERLEKQKRYAEQGYEELAQAMTPPGFVGPDVDPWSHDATFITHTPDFRDTWRSVQSTARKWAKEFKETTEVSASKAAPVLYHGTTKKAASKILKSGIKTTVGWGGANSEGVFLSGSKTGALMWAMSSLLSKNDEGGDPSKFFARGYSLDDLALIEVHVSADKLSDLKADMEQAEDYQYDGDEDDWEASLDQIGDVRFDGSVPASWLKEVSRSEIEKAADSLGYHKTQASVEGSAVVKPMRPATEADIRYAKSFSDQTRLKKAPNVVQWFVTEAYPTSSLKFFKTKSSAKKWLDREKEAWADDHTDPYYEEMEKWVSSGKDIEPIVLLEDVHGNPVDLWDGWHRVAIAIVHGVPTLPAIVGRVAVPLKAANSGIVRKNGRPRGTFLGDDHGRWEYSDGYPLGVRGGWQASIGLSSHNDWNNLSVNGATEFHEGFIRALREIVNQYPEVARYHIQFDGAWSLVSDVILNDIQDPTSLTFLHGTSTALLPTIMRDGIRPRSDTGVSPSYGHGSSAPEGKAFLVYLTTQSTMAQAAARAAARIHGGEPIVLKVRGIDWRHARPDEDSGAENAKESLSKLGSIGYEGRIPPSLITASVSPLVTVELTCIMQPDDDEVALDRSECTREMYVVAEKLARQHGGRVDKSEHYDFGENTLYGDAYARIPASALLKVLDLFDNHDVGYDNIDIPDGVDDGLVSTLEKRYPPRSGVMVNDNRTTVSAAVDVRTRSPDADSILEGDEFDLVWEEVKKPLSWFLVADGVSVAYYADHQLDAQDNDRIEAINKWADTVGGLDKAVQQSPVLAWDDGTVLDGTHRLVALHLGGYKSATALVASRPQEVSATELVKQNHMHYRKVLSGSVEKRPKKFYVVIPFSEDYAKKQMEDLSNGVLDGVLGISDHAGIIMQWYGVARDAILGMDAEELFKLNSLSKVQYENPEYLVSKGMAALYRIFDKKPSDKSGRRGIAGNLIDHMQVGTKLSNNRGSEILTEAKALADQLEKDVADVRAALKALPFEEDDLRGAVRSVTDNQMDDDDIEGFLKHRPEQAVKNLRNIADHYDGLTKNALLYFSSHEMSVNNDQAQAAAVAPKAEANALNYGWTADQASALVKLMHAYAATVKRFDQIAELEKKAKAEIENMQADSTLFYALDRGMRAILEADFAENGTDDIQTVKGLANRIYEVFSKANHWESKDIALTSYERAVRKALKSIGSIYSTEGEWLVKDRKLRIPPGSTLWVSKQPLPPDVAKRRAAGELTALDKSFHRYELARADALDKAIEDLGLRQRYKVIRVDKQKFDAARSKWYTKDKKSVSSAAKIDVGHDYHPSTDYDVVKPPKWAAIVKNILAEAKNTDVFDLLGIGQPKVYYVKFSDDDDVLAKYVGGTSSRPVIVISIDLAKQAKQQGVSLDSAIEGTLYHEIGHAYVDSTGMHDQLSYDEEERIVENFALDCGGGDIDGAIDNLTKALEVSQVTGAATHVNRVAASTDSIWEVLDDPKSEDEVAEALAPYPKLRLDFMNKTFDDLYVVGVERGVKKIVQWDGGKYPTIWDVDAFLYEADWVREHIEEYLSEQFNNDFQEHPAPLYHATTEENVESVLENGLEANSLSRGLSNRGVGHAIFTSDDREVLSEAYGPVVFKIDVPAMKRDGIVFTVEQEPGHIEYEAVGTLASVLDIDDFSWDGPGDGADDPSTVILHVGTVPPRYLKRVD